MVVSYNPGYQNALKDLKQSTRQRFVAIEFDFPTPECPTSTFIFPFKASFRLYNLSCMMENEKHRYPIS